MGIGRKKGEKSTLDFEIGYFAITFLVEKCFYLRTIEVPRAPLFL